MYKNINENFAEDMLLIVKLGKTKSLFLCV